MQRTQIYLDEVTRAAIEAVKERYSLKTDSSAIRLAIREWAALLAKQDATDRRRTGEHALKKEYRG